jgi:hypothetical protein
MRVCNVHCIVIWGDPTDTVSLVPAPGWEEVLASLIRASLIRLELLTDFGHRGNDKAHFEIGATSCATLTIPAAYQPAAKPLSLLRGSGIDSVARDSCTFGIQALRLAHSGDGSCGTTNPLKAVFRIVWTHEVSFIVADWQIEGWLNGRRLIHFHKVTYGAQLHSSANSLAGRLPTVISKTVEKL